MLNVTTSREPNIYLDLDGVFADFDQAALRLLGRHYRAMPPEEAWPLLSREPGLFAGLALIPGSRLLLEALRPHGARLRILTALPLPTGCLATAEADKRAWVARHLSPDLEVLAVTGGVNKHQLARPGDVLVDDTARNLSAWEAAGGLGVLHLDVPQTLAALKARQLI